MSTKHTPGPWHVYIDGSTISVCSGSPGGRKSIADMTGISNAPNDEANACLIAEAPNLLEFAEKVAAGGYDMADLMTEARAIIAKATGSPTT